MHHLPWTVLVQEMYTKGSKFFKQKCEFIFAGALKVVVEKKKQVKHLHLWLGDKRFGNLQIPLHGQNLMTRTKQS